MVDHFWLGLLGWNGVTFGVMAIDKALAVHQRRRVSEWVLFLIAFLMGGIGVFAGMRVCRHKTQKTSFQILVPLAILVNGALLGVALRYRWFG